jgi:hypothetical protein
MRSKWRSARLSLFTRVVLANAAVLTVVTLLLLFSPIEINAPVTSSQAVILVVGFLVSLAVSFVLLRRVVAPVRRLAETMRSVDPLEARPAAGGPGLGRGGRRARDRVQRHARPARARTARERAHRAGRPALCISTAGQAGPRVVPEIDLEGIEPSEEVELAVYRVAQESLTNVVRHAEATQVVVSLQAIDGGLRLVVRDDGRGLVPGSHDGAGITGMRERASRGRARRVHAGDQQAHGRAPPQPYPREAGDARPGRARPLRDPARAGRAVTPLGLGLHRVE